jgi:hypothetical protein
MIIFPKEVLIANLRDYFSRDSYYHYSQDQWGFPNTPSHKDLPLGAGTTNSTIDSTTRVYIGENNRFDAVFLPSILIKNNSSKSVPLSMNREMTHILYEPRLYDDGYGRQITFNNPRAFLFAGIWEGSISIEVSTRSPRVRDDLIELVSMFLTDIGFDTLKNAGVLVKPLSVSSPTDTEDRNDKIFKQSITFDIRTEWRREIPIGNIIESVKFALDFQNLSSETSVPAANLGINTEVNWQDVLIKL